MNGMGEHSRAPRALRSPIRSVNISHFIRLILLGCETIGLPWIPGQVGPKLMAQKRPRLDRVLRQQLGLSNQRQGFSLWHQLRFEQEQDRLFTL